MSEFHKRDRFAQVSLLLAGLLLFVTALGARDLWNPNEPLYGQAVKEMHRAGSWVLPTVEGRAFAEKPPLYFLLARIAALGPGVNEWTLRLPSALAGCLLLILTYGWVRRYSESGRALWAAAILGTTYAVFWNARSVQMDLLLTVCSAAAVYVGAARIDRDSPAIRSWILCGIALGLGVLTKGPVAVVIVALPLIGYATVAGRLHVLAEPAVLLAPLSAVLVALPVGLSWFYSPEGPTMLQELLYRQNVSRFVDAWDHQNPWWYFAKHFWLDMAPWGFLIPLAVRLRPKDERERNLHRLSWVWIGTVVFFFSLSSSKRSVYILPMVPAVAALASGVVVRWETGRLAPWSTRCALLFQAILGGTILSAAVWATRHRDQFLLLGDSITPMLGTLIAAGICTCLGVAVYRFRPVATPLALAVSIYSIFLAAAVWGLPAANPYKSARGFGEELNQRVVPGEPLAAFGLWEWRASYTYYSDRSFDRLDSSADLVTWWNEPETGWVLIEQGGLERARAAIDLPEPTIDRKIGSNRAFLFRRGGHLVVP